MGISTDPTTDEYSDYDIDFFLPDQTRKYIYITFSGIEYGTIVSHAYTCNKTIELEQVAPFPYYWRWEDTSDHCVLIIGPTYTLISYWQAPHIRIFWKQILHPYRWALANIQGPPSDPYWGGRAQISWTEPTYCPSIAGAQELMVIPRADHVMAEFWPLDDKAMVVRLASLRLCMRMHIKFDWTHFHQYNLLER